MNQTETDYTKIKEAVRQLELVQDTLLEYHKVLSQQANEAVATPFRTMFKRVEAAIKDVGDLLPEDQRQGVRREMNALDFLTMTEFGASIEGESNGE